jgi:hypothetical protein
VVVFDNNLDYYCYYNTQREERLNVFYQKSLGSAARRSVYSIYLQRLQMPSDGWQCTVECRPSETTTKRLLIKLSHFSTGQGNKNNSCTRIYYPLKRVVREGNLSLYWRDDFLRLGIVSLNLEKPRPQSRNMSLLPWEALY